MFKLIIPAISVLLPVSAASLTPTDSPFYSSPLARAQAFRNADFPSTLPQPVIKIHRAEELGVSPQIEVDSSQTLESLITTPTTPLHAINSDVIFARNEWIHRLISVQQKYSHLAHRVFDCLSRGDWEDSLFHEKVSDLLRKIGTVQVQIESMLDAATQHLVSNIFLENFVLNSGRTYETIKDEALDAFMIESVDI